MNRSLEVAWALVAFPLIIFFFNYISKRWRRYLLASSRGCKPAPRHKQKGPFGLDFFIKSMKASLDHRRMEFTRDLFNKYDRTWQVTNFGKEFIFTIDPMNIQWVMVHDFESWGLEPLRLPAVAPYMGPGVFTTDGQFWAHARAQVKPILGKAQFSDLSRLEYHFQNFLPLLPRDGSAVDVQPLLERLGTDIVTEFILGESVGTLTENSSVDHKKFLGALSDADAGVGKRFLLGKLRFFLRDKNFDKACQIAHKYVDERIDAYFNTVATRKSSSQEPQPLVLLNELAKETDDRKLIRSQILNILQAAEDGAAIIISNTLFLLSRHPDVQRTLREEISTINAQIPTFEVLKSMKYLRKVINESLRVLPLAPNNSRVALKDTILPRGGGPHGKDPVFVEKGMIYGTNSYILHRDKETWGEDADDFKPERWETQRHGWHYQAFGGGPRTCPGQGLVLTQISYTLIRLFQEFKAIESRDERPWLESIKLTMCNGNGVILSLR
ncbi:n-alkane-inducible cytochrome P450 [Mollisia scopiformis]|uniref:N-alkane-inducible cytochrome P450 n=1 Tax=Mollisia scopiformis TaxID=149040 RepID=A0A194XCG3_MOLSC|nr:n-alkane-inducible cytochrome P450 [Mollisia scopiformis]KUJ17437.1 n-alkane-inducible cytochrome P450 [Mollisia scopiformis]